MGNRTMLAMANLMVLPALAGACASLSPSEPVLPPGAVEVAAPAVYQEWYQRTESCSGLSGRFTSVQFYVVPGVETFPTEAGSKVGEWISDGRTNRIVIAGNYQGHEMVVRHELLHSLLRQEGHPAEYFVNRCQLTWESWSQSHGAVGSGL